MAKYIRTYSNNSEYEAAKTSADFLTPNVGYIEDTKEVKYLNSKKDLYDIYGTVVNGTTEVKYSKDSTTPSYYADMTGNNEFGIRLDGTKISFSYQDYIKTIDKLEKVESVNFIGCNSLETITLPKTISSIGRWSFPLSYYSKLKTVKYDGTLLDWFKINITPDSNLLAKADTFMIDGEAVEDVVIPSNITEVPVAVFENCKTITGLTMHDGITSIGNSAFRGCSNLSQELVLPSNITRIDDAAFFACSKLTGELHFPQSLTYIGVNAFNTTGISGDIVFPVGIAINDGVFSNTKITSVTIPEGVTRIGNQAFRQTPITELIVPNSVTDFGGGVTLNCNLKKLVLGTGIKTIGESFCFGASHNGCQITVLATTPPSLNSYQSFWMVDMNTIDIYVPSESIEAYKTAEVWSNYASRIQAIQ